MFTTAGTHRCSCKLKIEEKICTKIKHELPENQAKDTSIHWAFATIGKTNKKVIITQAHTRESGCGVGWRRNIHSSTHKVCHRPPADHQKWEDYVTVMRLAAKHTKQPSWLQATLKSLALIKPHNSFSFLCFFFFFNHHYYCFTLDWGKIGNLSSRQNQP